MAQLTLESFKNFFKYYKGEEHQERAIELLYKELECDCCEHLDEKSPWVIRYRNEKKDKPAAKGEWPITKAEMAEIMDCSEASLSDALMDDFARCADLYGMDRTNIAYFLGQCGHESAGLRYPVEIADGSAYEGRQDLNNIYPGDGVKFAGTGWIQVTGRYNHQAFSDYLQKKGTYDSKIMEVGKTYTAEVYPWSISGHWWYANNMSDYCSQMPPVDRVGQRVNGRYLPNGYEDRRKYSRDAFRVLGIPYPGN